MNASIRAHNLSGAASLAAFAGGLYSVMAERARGMHDIYRETPTRKKYRELFEATSRIEGAELEVEFLKNDNTVREMRCNAIRPEDYQDPTARYVTVFDIDKQAYRRVALDSILKMRVSAGIAA